MKLCVLDFEFNRVHEPKYHLVSVAFKSDIGTRSVWLNNETAKKRTLKIYLQSLKEDHVLLAFNAEAEAKSLISLGLNPVKFKWIDIQAEWKHLVNHNDALRYGDHFIDGKFKRTFRRQYGDRDDKRSHDKPPVNLLGCTYKLLKPSKEQMISDYEEKNRMRDIIIAAGKADNYFTIKQKEDILAYGKSDIEDLEKMLVEILKHYKKLLGRKYNKEQIIQEMLYRGATVARTGLISAIGYPVNREKITNFAGNVANILKDCQKDINSQFPDRPPFKWNVKNLRYSKDTKAIKEYIKEGPHAKQWDRTPTGDYSLSLDAFERFYSYRHEFPRNNFGAQYLRFLKLDQSLNGFKPKSVTAKNKNTFFDSYGSDDRAHPYLNSYGAQSARYQPKAIAYIPLKAAWMRSLIEPKPGRVIVSIDYGSEEFLISALVSGDKNMIKAYESGDVYLYFAKLAGAVPWEGTKADYKDERNAFKATTLGISYQMGAGALARKLTMDTGKEYSIEDAYDLINKFYSVYPDYARWVEDISIQYLEDGYLKLPDGWYLWGDNDNKRSVGNFTIQGLGSCILRKAIELCQDDGIEVIMPLHDALYCEADKEEVFEGDFLRRFSNHMKQAFAFYFEGHLKNTAFNSVRLDGDIWGPGVEKGFISIDGVEYKTQPIYIDPRSEKEYERFKKYF